MYKNLALAFKLLNRNSFLYKPGFVVQILQQIRINYFYKRDTLASSSSKKYKNYERGKSQYNYFFNKNQNRFTKLAAVLGLTLALCNSPDMTGKSYILFCNIVLITKYECCPIIFTAPKLLKAAQQGNMTELNFLLKDKIDLDVRHPLGWTPLMAAAVNGKTNAVLALLKAGAQPNLQEEFMSVHKTADLHGLHLLDGNLKWT